MKRSSVRRRLAALLLLTLLTLAAALPVTAAQVRPGFPPLVAAFKDDFSAGARGWQTIGGDWKAADGAYEVRHPDVKTTAFAVPRRSPLLEEQTIEATVTTRQRLANEGWTMAGIALYEDGGSYWIVSLTQDPDGGRRIDFLENHAGTWQAQDQPGDTRLAPGPRSGSGKWQENREYRMRLDLTRDTIGATVTDTVSGEVVLKSSFSFGTATAVRSGTVGLLARGAAARFDNVLVSAPAASISAPAGLKIEKGARGSVAILREALPGVDLAATDRIARELRAAGFGVTPIDAEQASSAAVLDTGNFALYVVPNANVYPGEAYTALRSYLRRHGRLLLLGAPPFSRTVWKRQGEWVDQEIIRQRVASVPESRVFLNFEGPALQWQRATNSPSVPSGTEIASGGPQGGGKFLRITMADMTGWNTFASPELDGLFGPGHDLLTFWAKGDSRTGQMAVELNEKDGSRWIGAVPLAANWSYHVMTMDDFRYWPDSKTSKTRGTAGDRVNPANVNRIVFGLSNSHTPAVGGGAHTIDVARIGSAKNPYQDVFAPANALPPLETVTPSYKLYPLSGIASLNAAPDQTIVPAATRLSAPKSVYSPIMRPMGRGFGNDSPWRMIPLLRAIDAAGKERGTPAWLLLNNAAPLSDSMIGAFAINDAATLQAAPVRRAIVDSALRMVGGRFLTEGGAHQFSWWPGEKVSLGASIRNNGDTPLSLSVRFTVSDSAGKALLTKTLPLKPPAFDSATAALNWNPAGRTAPCAVNVELIDGGKVIDRIRHDIGFLSTAKPAKDDFVTVRGSDFYLKGKKWYPIGMNYWPRYAAALEPDFYNRGWLERGSYDPVEIDKDLAQLKSLGLNMVSIQMGTTKAQRNLLDFMRRCAAHGIHVNGFLWGASPIAFDEKGVSAYLREGRLKDNPTLYAYDIIWEPGNSMFNAASRVRWEPQWRAWIDEQYGGIAAAEALWGFAAPRREGGVAAPADRQMSEDGPWRTMVAAYRRFMDDFMSRTWNAAVTRLRVLDPNHLIGYRQGNTLPHDFGLTATGRHIDFISPEGYSIPHSEAGYNAAGFITRFVHFTTGGKPIYWAEYGRSVWDSGSMAPNPKAIEVQGEYNDLFNRMALEAGANGLAPWWWPGGYRVNERSDFGVLNPDGTPRPSMIALSKAAPQLKAPREYPKPTTWMTIDRDANAGGYWYLAFNTGAEAYRAARAEGKNLGIRTQGTGTDSATTPLVGVGNLPYSGVGPLKYLNGEFDRVQVRDAAGTWVEATSGATVSVAPGKPVAVRVAAGNLQEATWLTPALAGTRPGAVYLTVAPEGGTPVRRPVAAPVPYLGATDFGEFTLGAISAPTRVVVRMEAQGRAAFGEKRVFTLAPTK